jgi:hypothetical protein
MLSVLSWNSESRCECDNESDFTELCFDEFEEGHADMQINSFSSIYIASPRIGAKLSSTTRFPLDR